MKSQKSTLQIFLSRQLFNADYLIKRYRPEKKNERRPWTFFDMQIMAWKMSSEINIKLK